MHHAVGRSSGFADTVKWMTHRGVGGSGRAKSACELERRAVERGCIEE